MNKVMDGVSLKVSLGLMLICLAEVSAFYNPEPELYSRARYERSRKRMTKPRSLDPSTDTGLDFVAIVNLYGYPAEEHLVTTNDGYNLRVHRIPSSPKSSKRKRKPIVYFQHGIGASSDSWVLIGPDNDLAYMLADAGYDVWCGNFRGNTYSRSHETLSPNSDQRFWRFSYHEMGVSDLPAVIDYILEVTGENTMTYLGHSMGTTASYILLSTRPEYNDKLNLVISLAPVAWWNRGVRPIISFLKTSTPIIQNFVDSAGLYELVPLTSLNGQVARYTCDGVPALQSICLNAIYSAAGFNPKQTNTSIQGYIWSYFPAGISKKTLEHFSQNMLSGEFKMYDYGISQNLARYRRTSPPYYDLNKITAPVILLYGKGDAIVSPSNVYELATRLPNVIRVDAMPDEQFTHLDFLFSIDIKRLLNDQLLSAISKVSGQDNYL